MQVENTQGGSDPRANLSGRFGEASGAWCEAAHMCAVCEGLYRQLSACPTAKDTPALALLHAASAHVIRIAAQGVTEASAPQGWR